jgi:lipid-binding SYLF domain-containing protein
MMLNTKRFLALAPMLLLLTGLFLTCQVQAKWWGKSAGQIDRDSRAALAQLYDSAPGAKGVVNRAVAVLVFPNIVKAGIGVGGEVGKGVLLQSGKTVGYYRIASGSIGFQLGAQKRIQVIAFMDKRAFARFKNSKGWKAGVDGSVVLADMGTSGEIDTHALNAPIVGFVLGEAGLMYNATLEGTRIWRFRP